VIYSHNKWYKKRGQPNVGWRLKLAELLAETKNFTEAIHQARICLRLRPQLNAARQLIATLSVMPEAIEQKPTDAY